MISRSVVGDHRSATFAGSSRRSALGIPRGEPISPARLGLLSNMRVDVAVVHPTASARGDR